MSNKALFTGPEAEGRLTVPGYGYWESYLPLALAQDVHVVKAKEENEQ